MVVVKEIAGEKDFLTKWNLINFHTFAVKEWLRKIKFAFDYFFNS